MTDSAAFVGKKVLSKKQKQRQKGLCFNCNKPGHRFAECKKEKEKSKKEHAVLGSASMATISKTNDEIVFVLDSGSTEHLIGDACYLVNTRQLETPLNILIAKDDECMPVAVMGDMKVESPVNGGDVTLNIWNIGVASGLRQNLFSVRRVESKGGSVTFHDGMAITQKDGDVIAVAKCIGILPEVQIVWRCCTDGRCGGQQFVVAQTIGSSQCAKCGAAGEQKDGDGCQWQCKHNNANV